MGSLIVRPPDRAALTPTLRFQAPPSKSHFLRALLASAGAGGGSLAYRGPLPGDVGAFLEGLNKLGVPMTRKPGIIVVEGPPDLEATSPVTLEAGDGAAPARFLLALAARLRRPVTVRGSASLGIRPMAGLARALASLGASVSGGPGLPLTVRGPIRGGDVQVEGARTSQFFSALLLVSPALGPDLRIMPVDYGVSRAYLDLTRDVMASFGVRVSGDFSIGAGSAYRPTEVIIEPDWSSATILLAVARFLERPVIVESLALASRQPDRAFAGAAAEAGLVVEAVPGGVLARPGPSRCATLDLCEFPDSVPALSALAALGTDRVRICGAAHLREKESDRIAALCHLLQAAGVDASPEADGLSIQGPLIERRETLSVATLADHRIAMAGALIGLVTPVRIDDASCVAKSFPGFFDTWPGVVRERDSP